MANSHHHHHASRCCCSHQCTTPPPAHSPPPPLADPFVVQSIVSQVVLLLQNPQIGHFPTPPPPFDHLHPYSSLHHPLPKHKQPLQDDKEHLYHNKYSALLQRIHLLESSINRFSSSSSSSLRNVAARTIQIHFRAYLVRRSTVLRELKELASIKSALNLLKSSFSLHNPPHFVSISRDSLRLIRRLDAVKSADQMVRGSKSSITREIDRFLGLVDENCFKRNVFESKKKTVKPVGMVRNEDKSRVSYAGSRDESSRPHCRVNKASKHQNNMNTGEKRLVDELRQRVERIHYISKHFDDEEENEEEFSDDDVRGSNGNYTIRCPRGDLAGKRGLQPHYERRVQFPEEGNASQAHDIHEDGEVPVRRVSGSMERRGKSGNDKQHENDWEEVESGSEENDVESAEDSQGLDEGKNASPEGSSQGSEAEEVATKCMTDESSKKLNVRRHILSAPPPVKMEG